ncbi:FBW10 protein, partial [Cochlearius cochlearius]|nr:FBW10 protein [Cochlearius cochlearius]
GGQPPAMCFWPQNTECLIQEGPDAEDNLSIVSLAHHDDTVVPASLQSPSNVNRSKDFIRCLPPHLSMCILGLLDQKSLNACAAVSRCWAFLAKEVKRQRVCQSTVQEKILFLQGLCPRGAVSNYAKTVDVTIPQLNEEGEVIEAKGHNWGSKTKEEADSLQAAYRDLQTDTIQLEERNVFCGSYNIRVLAEQPDRSRIIHYSGGNLVAIGSADRKVRLLGMSGMKEVAPLLSGHAGSIKALVLNEKKGFVLSASFDLSIRCWNIYSGACVKIFNGHSGTITCLDLHGEQLVSGARDGMVKVWNLESGKCLKTLKHNSAVWVVKTDGTRVVSGCDRGLVKVWRADTGALIKTLEGHQGPVKCLSFDQWHLVTGSTDGYALGWSMLGNLKRCLIAFRHPKEVLSLEFLYLRVISGCADGKIRIFNYLTGSCLKVLTANSRGDPISSFFIAENRMVINSPTSLLMFQFEDVRWDYTLAADRKVVGKKKQLNGTSSRTPLQRAKRHDRRQTHRLALETRDADQLTPSCWVHRRSPKGHGAPQSTAHPWSYSEYNPANNNRKNYPQLQMCLFVFLETDGKSERGPSPSAHPDRAEATLQHEKRRGPRCPMTPDKFLLTVGTLQNACKSARVSSSVKHAAKVREAWEAPWEHQQHRPERVQIFTTPLQHRKDQIVRLQHARLHSDSLTPNRTSVPFETKMLQLKMKNSLHGPAVNSSIPAPSVVRPKTCGVLREKKAPGGRGKVVPLPEDGVRFIDPFTASSEPIRSAHVAITDVKNEAVSRRKKTFCPYAADPSWRAGGLRLVTGKEKAECEAATVARCQARQAKLTEDQQRARKKAWLRKIKGLPVDSFTEEGKIPAPELGLNTFI